MASENLYVTYVDVDGDLLKIWGQKNRIGATYIERQLLQMLPDFNRMPCPDSSSIRKGAFCFAKYTDGNFYRARVVSDVKGDSVGVLFVDYGNRDFIKISNIRIQQGNEDVFTKMSEQAEEYYLARVLAPQSGWTVEIIGEIRQDICYDEFRFHVVAQSCDQKIVEIEFHNQDFSKYLVKKQLARPLQLTEQKQMIFSYCNLVTKSEALKEKIHFSPSIPPPNIPSIKPQNSLTDSHVLQFSRQNLPVNFPKPPPTFYPPSRHLSPMYQQIDKSQSSKNLFYSHGASQNNPVQVDPMSLVNTVINPLLNNHSIYDLKNEPNQQFNSAIQILAEHVKQCIAQDNAKSEENKEPHYFVNSVLEVGSNYNVFISHIDDGPWSFSIQLLSSETELQKLMEELSSLTLTPLKPPIILGHPCIASSKLYGNLCRGVIVSISHSSVKVYFVDFGNTEDLPSSCIYELPTSFFKFRVLSQKFSLSGLEKVTYSEDIKKFFKEVVQDELLMLRVTSLKGENLPTCELYVKDKNIKRILNEKIREMRNLNKDDFPKVGDTESVVVTWIVSPQKFFVQLHKRDSELNELKKELAEAEKRSQKIPSNQLAVGLKCICMFESDRQWYRAVITDIDAKNGISVFYVDYGNTENVNASSLRKIDGACLINQLNPQAIQCSLNGFENKTSNEYIKGKLEELVLEKEFKMKVVSSEKEVLCVQLFDGEVDVGESLLKEASQKREWEEKPLPVTEMGSNSFESKTKMNSSPNQWENRTSNRDWPEGRNFQNDKNWRKPSDRKHNEYQSINSSSIRCNLEDKGPSRGDRHFTNKQRNEGENQWNDQKPGRNAREFSKDGNSAKKGGFKQERGNWDNKKMDNFQVERKTFNADRNAKKFDENRKFEKKIDSWEENKQFGTAGQKPEKKFDQTRSTRKPIRQEDIAPPGSRFKIKSVDIGSSDRGIVTYYFNPNEFYIQLLNQENEFKKMMQDIQVYYSDKYSLRNPVETGDIVIAEFTMDKILYRAEVVRPTPVTVRYVDYGNRELVPAKGTWAVDKKFLELPEQVIQCRLANIQPTGSDWPPPGSAIDKFFEKEEYKCTITGYENGVYEVILEACGSDTDVATEIIAAGLGQPETVATIDIPKIDYSLLPCQCLRLYITHVVSSSKFYVILDPQTAGEVDSNIKEYVKSQKVLAPLEKSSIKPGTSCLTAFDNDSYCRGIITKVDRNSVSVWFSDRGDDIEVTTEKIKRLPTNLAEIEPQAVECCLDESNGVEDEEEFRKSNEYQHHLVSVVSVLDKKLSVVLYNEDGRKTEFQKDTSHPKEIQPTGDVPLLFQKLPLVISYVNSPNEIYIQRSCDWNDLNELNTGLSEFYTEEKEVSEVDIKEIGHLVAAKSIEYDVWYRGRIMSFSDDSFEVLYIDFGNKETLPKSNIQKLDASFMRFSRFAKNVILDADISKEILEEIKSKPLEILLEREFLGCFRNEGGKFYCKLLENENEIDSTLKKESDEMNKTDKVDFSSANSITTAQHQIQGSTSDSDSGMKVFISHIDSPKQFWVHKENRVNDLQQFQDNLQKINETLHKKESFDNGSLVAVPFSGAWYRAKVTAVEGSSVTVQLIDYGNTIVVDTNQNTIKELTPELREVPVFATSYSLHGHWNAHATAKFEEIILSSEDPVSVVTSEDCDTVDLLQNGKSVCEILTQEDVACDSPTVYISHINSPNDFYIQKVVSSERLFAVNEKLSDTSSLKILLEPQENQLCAAKFPEDGVWYRAKIIEKHADGFNVFFIDYGNKCITNEIKELPDDLTDVPCIAEHCSLMLGHSFDVWSETACEKFLEYLDGRTLEMEVIVSRPKKSVVKLTCEGKNITEELGKFCENDGRSEVYITYAISPTEFYLRYVDDETYEEIANKLESGDELEDLEDRQPGTLCVVRFVDDGCWYRAKILKNLEEGCEVFFIDFGNVSVSNEVKKIPPELKEIPSKALKCSFDWPEKNIPECVKEEFLNVTLDSEHALRARIITPGEVNIVSIKLNGRILEEALRQDYDSVFQDQTVSSIEGTDDDKNLKLQNNYLNIEDDARADNFITNETDEEKRVKIGITVGDEGFKCDDEKGSEALSCVVNATDSELIEGSQDTGEEPDVVETVEEVLETTDERSETETQSEDENRNKFVRDKTQKIVPGCISRGEEETTVSNSPETTWRKLKHSEKVVPGSITRGFSLELMPNSDDAEETVDSTSKQVSQSLPCTPKFGRRHQVTDYVKTSPNDRLVPGCISTGAPLHVSPFVEKIPSTEKIVAGAVNGSTLEE